MREHMQTTGGIAYDHRASSPPPTLRMCVTLCVHNAAQYVRLCGLTHRIIYNKMCVGVCVCVWVRECVCACVRMHPMLVAIIPSVRSYAVPLYKFDLIKILHMRVCWLSSSPSPSPWRRRSRHTYGAHSLENVATFEYNNTDTEHFEHV